MDKETDTNKETDTTAIKSHNADITRLIIGINATLFTIYQYLQWVVFPKIKLDISNKQLIDSNEILQESLFSNFIISNCVSIFIIVSIIATVVLAGKYVDYDED